MFESKRYYYLIKLQFLGFRLHGWQKQPETKTVQGMVDKTICYVLGHKNFKTLGASRTDAMVSASEAYFELFVWEQQDIENLKTELNLNLPNDIRILDIEEVDEKFNIIQHAKIKEYVYLFSFGKKNHPFCAPFLTYIQEGLDIKLMKEGAKQFEGTHNFRQYAYKPNDKTQFEREITKCEIKENNILTANFFPSNSYALHVMGAGFMRHQVRLMMGTLFRLGKHEITLSDIQSSLQEPGEETLGYLAPASGLMLNGMNFKEMEE